MTKRVLGTKYRLLLDNSQDIIIFFDKLGKIIACNRLAEGSLGYGEIYRLSITDIFRKAIKMVNNELVINLKFKDKSAETVAYRMNQTCFPIKLTISIFQRKRKYVGICIASFLMEKKAIIQELRQARNELKQTNQLRNEFVANISHELRTPVNGIMGLVDNLLETELTPGQLDTVNIIRRCAINMSKIINDLLDYTKYSNNKFHIEKTPFCFPIFIRNVIDYHINKINEKGLKLLVNVADDIPTMLIGDELRLTQILNNLLSNAIKFTSIGHIALEVVQTERTEDEVELFFVVMDTGIGISLDQKDKLFRSFTQIDGSITRRFGGTGLGLSISKLLVESMQGSINVESEPDKGSSFSFTVRLGISKDSESEGEHLEQEYRNELEYKNICMNNDFSKASEQEEAEYISRLLERAKAPDFLTKDIHLSTESMKSTDSEITNKEIMDLMERLMICIEMESWSKAEEFVDLLKKYISEDDKELKNITLKLVLSVRKESHDHSLLYLDELRKRLTGEN